MSEQRRLVGVGDVITFLYTLPLAVAGLVWLIGTTDGELLRQELPVLGLIFALIILFSRVSYFIIIEIRTDRYGSTDGSLASMVFWSAIFLFGPTALWLLVIWIILRHIWDWRENNSPGARWNQARSTTKGMAATTIGFLVALFFYESWGGTYPLAGLTVETILPALGALFIHFLLLLLIWSGYILYHIRVQKAFSSTNSIQPLIKFIALSLGLPYLAHPFAILAAGLYVQNGPAIYLFFLVGLLLVAILARQLSWTAERNRQQSRQLEKLEQLGRAIINAPLDASLLPSILQEHVPNMFPSGRVAIWISPDQLLFKHPDDWPAIPENIWEWLLQQKEAQAFLAKDELPWDKEKKAHYATVIAPILETESSRPIGGIYLEVRALVQAWDFRSLSNLFPAVQTLAAQIASALHQADMYAQTLALQNVTQELRLAGKIQASFLPNQFPTIPGWQLAVTLLPARETSGDFFDVIPIADDRLGILIADVADKGVGPALYMALSRTLIRTYALDYDAEPEVVFFAANNRLLQDARANLFVTAIYGILDPAAGSFTYCNAGHNPPFLICKENGSGVQALTRTGMAMGIEEEATWTQESVHLDPGDVLLLYTDGIPDAQNNEGQFFDDEALIETAQANLGKSAHEIQAAILEKVTNFTGDTPQFDDITLMILVRDM